MHGKTNITYFSVTGLKVELNANIVSAKKVKNNFLKVNQKINPFYFCNNNMKCSIKNTEVLELLEELAKVKQQVN